MQRIYLKISTILLVILAGPAAVYPGQVETGPMRRPTDSGGAVYRAEPEVSMTRLVALGAIDLFRKRISPVDGPRCGFSPTCSTFGHEAIRNHGVLEGGLLTADRLIRCNNFKRAGDLYRVLPGGKLSDPVPGTIHSR